MVYQRQGRITLLCAPRLLLQRNFCCQQCYLEDEKKQVNEEDRRNSPAFDKTLLSLTKCNVCGHESLWFNPKMLVYECLNFTCEQVISSEDLEKAKHNKSPAKVDYSQVDSRGEIDYKADVSPDIERSRSYCEEHRHYFEIGVGCKECINTMLGKSKDYSQTFHKQAGWYRLFKDKK
jgi:hypothetical protein